MSTDVIRAAIDELERVGEWLMYHGGEVSRGQRAVDDAKRAREQLRQVWTDMDRMRNDAEAYRRGADRRRTDGTPSEAVNTCDEAVAALKQAKNFILGLDQDPLGRSNPTILKTINAALAKATSSAA